MQAPRPEVARGVTGERINQAGVADVWTLSVRTDFVSGGLLLGIWRVRHGLGSGRTDESRPDDRPYSSDPGPASVWRKWLICE